MVAVPTLDLAAATCALATLITLAVATLLREPAAPGERLLCAPG